MSVNDLRKAEDGNCTLQLCHIVHNKLFAMSERIDRMKKEIITACREIEDLIERERKKQGKS